MKRQLACGCCLVLTLFCGSCAVVPPPVDPGGPSGDGVVVETIVAEAAFPVAIAFRPDGSALYTEKETGMIRVLGADGTLVETPFADVAVTSNSERGLLGITLHPGFAENGFVYAFYTRSNTGEDTRVDSAAEDNRVVRFTATGDIGSDETLIVSLPVSPGPNHNGGNIRFGPDGKLYITLGELGVADNAQSLDSRAGKILRHNDDGTIPADNPFGADNAVYALGLRNTFDFAFDPDSEVIFSGENGTSLHDEINRLPARSNGGWPLVEGAAGDSDPQVDVGVYVEPIVEFAGIVVPTGVDFAPDDTFGAGTAGRLFVGQFNTGRIRSYELSTDRALVVASEQFVQGVTGGITDVAFAPDGSMYVLTTTSVLRITPE